jgi:hypothetical protein
MGQIVANKGLKVWQVACWGSNFDAKPILVPISGHFSTLSAFAGKLDSHLADLTSLF